MALATHSHIPLAVDTCVLRSFGLSRVMDPTQTHVSGHAMGTAFYVAPEVARGGQLSKHADVFSWGVMVGATGATRMCTAEGHSVGLWRSPAWFFQACTAEKK